MRWTDSTTAGRPPTFGCGTGRGRLRSPTRLAQRLDDEAPWADEFDLVADDLRAALRLASARPDPTGYELACSTGHLAFARGLITEAERHLRDAASRATTSVQAAHALQTAAHVASNSVRTGTVFQLLVDAAGSASGADDALQATCLAQAVESVRRFTGGLDEPVPYPRLRRLLDDAHRLAPPADLAVSAWLAAAEAWMATEDVNEPDPELTLTEAALAQARSVGEPALICAAIDARERRTAEHGAVSRCLPDRRRANGRRGPYAAHRPARRL